MNFLNICLTTRTLALSDFHLLGPLKNHLGGQVLLMTKRFKQRYRSSWDNILLCCGFQCTGKAMGQVYQCWWKIYWEINVLFQVKISHVLCFISIYDLFTYSPSYNAAKEQIYVLTKAKREKKTLYKASIHIWHVTNRKHSGKHCSNRRDSLPKMCCCVIT
jgi:hypothetical protein